MRKTGAHPFLFFRRTMKPLDTRLGRVIRSARDRRGLTQADLARRCGISRRHVAAIERGANFTVAVLVAIAAELPEIAPPLLSEFLMLMVPTPTGASSEHARVLPP